MRLVTDPESISRTVTATRAQSWATKIVLAFASVVSVISTAYFYAKGDTLVYNDSISHMEIARRFFDSPTPGFGQLGGVWLPLPHILMAPLTQINALYYSGLAGSIISMIAYVVTCVLIYKIVLDLTGKQGAAAVATLVFMVNPNVLYMQSTPMTELLLFACLTGMVYGVQRWTRTDNYRYLVYAALAGLLGTLTRYEAWVLLVALVLVVAFVAWRKRFAYEKGEGLLLSFLFVGAVGIVGWIIWNWIIFGNPMNFQNGQYAKPSLWVGAGDVAIGHLMTAAKTYWFAVQDNLGILTIVLAAGGLVALVVKERIPLRSLAALSMLVFFPFFVVAIYQGQRPLHVMQVNGNLYNVRFGLLSVLLAAILIGCAASALMDYEQRFVNKDHKITLAIPAILFAAVIATSALALVTPNNIVTLQEPTVWQNSQGNTSEIAASNYMKAHYHGGLILAQFFGNEDVLYDAHISPGTNIYEGSYKLWQPALTSPASQHISWIVMHHAKGVNDQVYDHLHDSAALKPYRLVYSNASYSIYQKSEV